MVSFIVKSFIAFGLINVVSANKCQALCVEKLGKAACINTSYCNSNGICQGLSWTDSTKTSICLAGSAGFADKKSVTCADVGEVPPASEVVSKVTTATTTGATAATTAEEIQYCKPTRKYSTFKRCECGANHGAGGH